MSIRNSPIWRKIMLVVGIIVIAVLVLILSIVLVFWTRADRAVLLNSHSNFEHEGLNRSYLLYQPSDDIERIVVGFHGFGDNARRFAYYTALHNVTDDKTLVVYPQASAPMEKGIKNGWNAGFCCGSGWVAGVDDVGFISDLVTELNEKYAGGSAKVYVTGFSNGAFFSQRLATDRPDLIDAVAISSGSIGTTKQQLDPQEPTPILLMHGEKDTIVPFNGGPGSGDPDFEWQSFDVTKSVWEDLNSSEIETRVITYPQNRHQWDGWRIVNFWHTKPNASLEAIKFFYDTER